MSVNDHKISVPVAPGLPIWKLLAFTLAGFLAIMTETMPAGLLPQISESLNVSKALAGQLITFYALGSVLAAIPVIAATRSWNRRRLFMLAVGALLVFNIITRYKEELPNIISASVRMEKIAPQLGGKVAKSVVEMEF